MPTHFAGLPVDIERLYAIAQKYGLRVIEDAALCDRLALAGSAHRRIRGLGGVQLTRTRHDHSSEGARC